MPRELTQLTSVEGGETVVASSLLPEDAPLMGKAMTQLLYEANVAQYAPHAIDEEEVRASFDPYDETHHARQQRVIEHVLSTSHGGTVVVAETLVPEASVLALSGVCLAYTTIGVSGVATYLQEIAVDPREQRKGIGSLLMLTALQQLIRPDHVALDALSCNPAVAWYDSLGYKDSIEGRVMPDMTSKCEDARTFHMTAEPNAVIKKLGLRVARQFSPTVDTPAYDFGAAMMPR